MPTSNGQDSFAMPEETLRSSAPLFELPYPLPGNDVCPTLPKSEMVAD